MLLFKGKGRAVAGLAFSPDGATLAACAYSRVELWNVATGTAAKLSNELVWDPPTDNLRFDPTGRWLFVASGWHGLWAVYLGTRAVTRIGRTDADQVAVSPTGDRVLVNTGRLAAFDIRAEGLGDRTWTKTLGGDLLEGVDFFPDGRRFASGESRHVSGTVNDWQTRIRVRSAADGAILGGVECDCSRAGLLKVSPDGAWVAYQSASVLHVRHPTDGTIAFKLPSPNRLHVTGIAFHPSGKFLATTSNDATVRLHDRDAGWAVTRTFDWNIGGLKSVAFNPEGTLAAAGGEKGQIVLWDVDL